MKQRINKIIQFIVAGRNGWHIKKRQNFFGKKGRSQVCKTCEKTIERGLDHWKGA